MSPSTLEIKGRPHVRALAGAAGLSLLGMATMGLTAALKLDAVFATVGMVVALGGIGLLLLAQEAARKSGVMVRLDDAGFALVSSRTRLGLAWSDVKKVSIAGNRLIVRDAAGKEVTIVAPPGARPGELDALADAMATHLDASRGYHAGPLA